MSQKDWGSGLGLLDRTRDLSGEARNEHIPSQETAAAA